MAIKQQGLLTRQDFEDALGSLRISVAEVAKDTAIPRAYLSELRNHGTPLRRDLAEKLRTYFEGKGVEFDSNGGQSDDDAASPHPRLKTTTAPRCYFPIDERVPDDVVASAMDTMEENDARMVVLLKQTITRNDGFLGDGDYTDEAKAALQEAIMLMASNYYTFRKLRGWPALKLAPATEDMETVGAVLLNTFRETLVKAGMIEPDSAVKKSGDAELDAANAGAKDGK